MERGEREGLERGGNSRARRVVGVDGGVEEGVEVGVEEGVEEVDTIGEELDFVMELDLESVGDRSASAAG